MPRHATPLTDARARNAKPKAKPYKLSDGRGLHLLVTPNGGKLWRFAYRLGGKQKLYAIGTYADVTLAEARDELNAARKLVKAGIDPVDARREKRRQALARVENSFESVAREWHSKQGKWVPAHARSVLHSLEKDVFPYIGAKSIQDITAADILAVLRRIEARGALNVASRVQQRVSRVFRYAIATDRVESNPAADLVGSLRTRKGANHAALGRADLPEFFVKLHAYEHPVVRRALHLLALTFVRSSELRGARWDEIDFERAEWRIPAERMKIAREHIVPLSRQAITVLDELRPLTGHYRLVFAGHSPVKPIGENSLTHALHGMGYRGKATAHGFRATASTILNELGFDGDVVERQLAHVERNKTRAAYHRSQYLPERRRMMQAWADYLDSVQHGDNVVPMRRSES